MPAFNAEKTIVESIESVIEQKFTNFELLICDDNSTDLTRSIISNYVKKDSRIKLVKNVYKKGAVGARNSCLSVSKSRFICFLDSDDLWEKDKLYLQIEYMIKNNLEMSHGAYVMFDESGDLKKISPPHKISYNNILKRCEIGCLTVMIDTNKINNIFLPDSPKEDYALWVQIMKSGYSSYLTPSCSARYRKQNNSLSSSKLKEISKQWYVLKHIAHESFFKRIFYIVTYILNGFIKHFIY